MIIVKNSNFVLIAHTSCPLDLALVHKLKVLCRMILFEYNENSSLKLRKELYVLRELSVYYLAYNFEKKERHDNETRLESMR